MANPSGTAEKRKTGSRHALHCAVREKDDCIPRAFLRESTLGAVLRFAPFGVALLDRTGRPEAANEAFTDITEYAPDELSTDAERGIWSVLLVAGEGEPDRVAAAWQRMMHEENEPPCTFTLCTKSGRLKDVEFSISPAQSDGIRVLILSDVSERAHLLRATEQTLLAERELRTMQVKFLSMVSHEFRTPLTTILSSAEILERYGASLTQPRISEYVERIRNGVKAMQQLLEMVTRAGREEAEPIQCRPTLVRMPHLCTELAAEVERLSETAHSIICTFRDTPEETWLDPVLLRSILVNVLSNAVRYSPHAPEVLLDVSVSGGHLVFTVTDHGLGIPQEFLPRIFLPFTRGDNVGHIHGTGMGLVVARRFAEAHGGRLNITSGEGKGTIVTILIPLQREPRVEEKWR